MELVYIWIKDHKILKDFEMNFGWEKRFSYNPINGLLTWEEDEDYIPHFFGTGVANISALVGRNGAGKSTAVEFVVEFLTKGESADPEAIIIHYDSTGDRLIVYVYPSLMQGLQIWESYKFRHQIVTSLRNEYDYPDIVYYTNSLYDRVVAGDQEGLHNSSLNKLLFGKSLFENDGPKRSGQEFYNRFRFAEYGRIVSFLYSSVDKGLAVDLPGYLMISAIFSPEIDFSFNDSTKTQHGFTDVYEKIVFHYNDRIENEKLLKDKFLTLVERNIVLDELYLHAYFTNTVQSVSLQTVRESGCRIFC